MKNEKTKKRLKRRDVLVSGLKTITGFAVVGTGLKIAGNSSSHEMVWQIDPDICTQCERCSTNCVLPQSAVKCVHSYSMCGYCDLCSGYLVLGASSRDTGAESQLCPTGAIKRTFIEDPYYEYTINEELCIGCARCVKGCGAFGNGSMYLQIRHNLCLNCNECSIAVSCPAQAIRRVPANSPYILRGDEAENNGKNG